MKDLALVVDTTLKYSDIWDIYFDQLNKFFPSEIKRYIFTDVYDRTYNQDIVPIYYNNDDSYRNQFLSCLKNVKEKYILYNSEDYVLYDNVDMDEVYRVIDILDNDENYDFVKFLKGPEITYPYSKDHKFINIIDPSYNLFAQQASVWKKDALISIFENSPSENGRMQQEPGGTEVCRKLNIGGLQYFRGEEKKRGYHHWDSHIFPYIATAIVKGKWNFSEYFNELEPLIKKYQIDPIKRGIL